MELSQPQNPEFRINPENFQPCTSISYIPSFKNELGRLLTMVAEQLKGSYVKIKDISRTSKRLSYCLKD